MASTAKEELELRAYFLVPYNISPIQQAIQAGHSMGEYALKYGRYSSKHVIWDFLEKWKTWIVLNGGTTNSILDLEMVPLGSLDQAEELLKEMGIEYASFIEPDLNNALTSLCVIADSRVFDMKEYPKLETFAKNTMKRVKYMEAFKNGPFDLQSFQMNHPSVYTNWENSLGGAKNVFLRELLMSKPLA